MKNLKNIALIAITGLLFIGTALANDESDYNERASAKSAQRTSVLQALESLYPQADQLDQSISSLQTDVTTLTNTLHEENEAVISARSTSQAAQAALAGHQTQLSDLYGQLNSAIAERDLYDGWADQIAWQLYDAWWYYSILSSQFRDGNDWEVYMMMVELETEIEELEANLDEVDAEYYAAVSLCNSLSQQVSSMDFQVSLDTTIATTAQNSYDQALANWTVDADALDQKRDDLYNKQHERSILQTDIESKEDIVAAQEDWLNANPNWQAWVNNGRP